MGVIKRRKHARFALEPRQALGMRCKPGRQDLDRHVAPELGISRAIDLAHAASPKHVCS
jgi:hypothetical protein